MGRFFDLPAVLSNLLAAEHLNFLLRRSATEIFFAFAQFFSDAPRMHAKRAQ
jgi:hypothetical protein